MPIVNFAISNPLKQKINFAMEEYGFGSQAEFFRFLAINFLDKTNQAELNEEVKINKEFEETTKELAALIKKAYGGKILPSVEEQLADIL